MRHYSKFIVLAGIFVALSALTYLIHYYIFRDVHHIFIYMVGDLAFLPLEVFLVVIVLERILAHREKQNILQKLNMVIGAFFSEVGNSLLHRLPAYFERSQEIRHELAVDQNWTHADFKKALAFAISLEDRPDYVKIDLETLKTLLVQKRVFLLALLENPNLLEHDRFTDLLWATFHLTEELEARPSLENLPDTDLQHIATDIQRVYRHLTAAWLLYMEHLKANYPFLFSLETRTHPFQEHPSPIVT